jgi:hypothetical protein
LVYQPFPSDEGEYFEKETMKSLLEGNEIKGIVDSF